MRVSFRLLGIGLIYLFTLTLLSCNKAKTRITFFNSNVTTVDTISFSNAEMTDNNGVFQFRMDFENDDNENASLQVFYCNATDSPGCSPTLPLGFMLRGVGSFSLNVISWVAPNEEGDSLTFRLVGVDSDGVTSSSEFDFAGVVPANGVVVSNLFVGNVDQQSFDVSVDLSNDANLNSTSSLAYCNLTDSPGCIPGTSLGALTRGANNFYKSILAADLAAGDDPGDSLRLRVITVDSDGVTGSPQDYTFALATAGGVTHIYRSVGPSNTSSLETGGGNAMSIAGSTATFSSALADNVGVGDVIQYDSDGNSSIDAVAFIYARLSSTSYTVKNNLGAAPTAVVGDNDWSIFRAHISIANGENGIENTGIDAAVRDFDAWAFSNDIVALNQVWHIAVYADAVDTVSADFSGWTTSAKNYMRVFVPSSQFEVGVSQRHSGVWDNTKARHEVVNARNLYILNAHVVVEGLQFKSSINNTLGSRGAVQVSGSAAADITIKNNIIWGDLTGTGGSIWGIRIFNSNSSAIIKVFNNVVYDFDYTGSYGIYGATTAPTYVYSNTVYACDKGYLGNSTTVLKNNIAQNSVVAGYQGTLHASSDYNLSDFADTTGVNSVDSSALTFANAAGRDFHLVAGDTDAVDSGLDLSTDLFSPFSSDIVGNERTGIWDMGAFNF